MGVQTITSSTNRGKSELFRLALLFVVLCGAILDISSFYISCGSLILSLCRLELVQIQLDRGYHAVHQLGSFILPFQHQMAVDVRGDVGASNAPGCATILPAGCRGSA